jgi:hypothetical protein
MGIEVHHVLALARWHAFRFLRRGGLHGEVVWLLIGLVLVGVVIWALSRRNHRWF